MKQALARWLVKVLGRLSHDQRGTPQRFLVPAYTGLGNFILMTPMIHAIRRDYPDARIRLLAGNAFGTEQVLRGTSVVDDVWVLDERAPWWRKVLFFLRLRRCRIDVAFVPFDASPSFFRIGVLLAGVPVRIGHTAETLRIPMGWTRDALTHHVPVRTGRHETDLHFDLLEILVPGLVRSYETAVAMDDSAAVLGRLGLEQGRYAVLQISAANGSPSPKLWPIENFLQLAAEIDRHGLGVVLVADTNEKRIADDFAKAVSIPVINLAGKTSIAQLAAVLRGAAVLVCHDSGTMHIGNAVGVPLVALYGPTDYEFTRPLAATSLVLREDLPCAPCLAGFAKTEDEALRDCPINLECMRRLRVSDVLSAVLDQASRRPSQWISISTAAS